MNEEKITVTSNADIDFPELQWGIHAGETRELPVDEAAQEIILSNDHIKKVEQSNV